MKQIVYLFLYFTYIYAQKLKNGEKCKCAQLMTESDCQKVHACSWDNLKMVCSISNVILTQQYLLENIEELKPSKAKSFYCNLFDEARCILERSCIWFKKQCTHFTGCTAYLRTSHESCQGLSRRCISNGNNCVDLSDCFTYKEEFSCTKNNIGQYCFWNKLKKSCELPDSCERLPQVLSSHQECHSQINYCTVKEGGGCVQMGYYCSDQKSQASCVTNIGGNKQCFWGDNQCLERICDNASLTLKTDGECRYFLPECTTKLGGGCVKRSNCQDAQIEQACQTNYKGEICIWNTNQCLDSLCENAPETYITNQQCQSIHNICSTNGSGCFTNYGCEFAPNQERCQKDGDGKECFWNGTSCVLRQCSLAISTIVGNDSCTLFMSKCTGLSDGKGGCTQKSCQNAPTYLSSNEDCEKYFPHNNCVSKKGGGCQVNVICAYIDHEIGCKIDIYGNLCQWNQQESKCSKITTCSSIKNESNCVLDHNNELCIWVLKEKQEGNCIKKSCSTAPSTYIREEECQIYFIPTDGSKCTTTKDGGCKVKGSCQEATCIQSCTTDKEGNICFWDGDNQQCRLRECKDIQGNTFAACQQIDNRCTRGLKGQCDIIKNCHEITNKYSCIQGNDGPCLWIESYKKDNFSGACFQFDSCNSIQWRTDAECKSISNYCTTNGSECVPITTCRDTNTTGGCVTGIDGDCVQSIPALGSLEPETCQLLLSCSQAYYLTHKECQKANSLCTTNGITGCRSLSTCDFYIEEACHFNHIGPVTDEKGHITSTGRCVWDKNQQFCNNEQCEDLVFVDNASCSKSLSHCTSDGTKCINKLFCPEYSNQELCSQAVGIEGQCIWIQSRCRQSNCGDMKNGATTEICSSVENCVSDGIQCIGKRKCSDYRTKISCNSIGLDGLCYWTEQSGQCALMDGCSAAKFDQIACQQASDRCLWVPAERGKGSQCQEHTCETFENQIGECQYFQSWDWQSYNICKFVSQQCMAFDVHTLQEDNCYMYSLEQYRWNPISNSCKECDTNSIKMSSMTDKITEGNGAPVVLLSQIFSIAMELMLQIVF